ncbi:hypothetical protein BS78_10G072900 [Paspalum vaginatum]|nr:hypothetical protein BS78_10G072900 [Paspalum vaginatum]
MIRWTVGFWRTRNCRRRARLLLLLGGTRRRKSKTILMMQNLKMMLGSSEGRPHRLRRQASFFILLCLVLIRKLFHLTVLEMVWEGILSCKHCHGASARLVWSFGGFLWIS